MSNFFLQYPSNGVQKYSSFSAFPSVAADGALALAKDTDILYAYSAGSASWVEIGGPGSVLSVGTIDSTTASSNGAAIVADSLIMQSASTSKPGLVNNTTQSMSGAKTFTTSVASPNVLLNGSVSGALTHTVPSAVTPYSLQWPASQAGGATFLKNDGSGGLSWASGTGASGVDSVGTINAQAKSADAAVISGTTIYFQTADATNPGQVSTAAQTFAGTKTFANIIDSGLTASTVPYADASKQLTSSAVTPTELGYVSGVTSAIQTQLNGKQATLTTGNLTDVGTDGIVVTGGTGAVIGTGTSIAQHVADSTHNGYLTSTDWSTFNGKQASGSYITDLTGDVSASGPGSAASTLATVNTNTGAFGSSTAIPNFTVNGKGLITAAGTNAVVAPASTLTGTTLASNVVTSSLTSVGTIATGTWSGTTIALNKGGTGQTTKAAAFDALSPMTTGGDLIYGGASGTATRLANGNSGQVLTSGGTTVAPSWTTISVVGSWATNVTTINATSSNPTKATTPAKDQISYRLNGKEVEIFFIYYQTSFTGAASGTGTYLIPTSSFGSPTLDTTYIVASTNTTVSKPAQDSNVGHGTAYSVADSSSQLVAVQVYDTSNLKVWLAGTTGQWWGANTATSSYKLGSGNEIAVTFNARVPVV